MKKIALVNITPNCIGPMMDCTSEYTDIKPIQYLDSTILDEIRKEDRITDRCMGRMLSMIAKACVDGAEGIILTCTMFSKYVELFRKLFSVPIVGADVAMMEDAGKSGGKTAILCTFEGTREVSAKLLKKYCQASGKPYTIDTYVLQEAYDEAQAGNMEKHDERIREKIRELDLQYDKIVLAQMSMAGAVKGLKLEQAVWIAHSLFERGKTAGSTANMSFRHEDKIYITARETCFGTLKKEDFAVIDLNGEIQGNKKPSKEFPLHLSLYQEKEQTGAVIHTHSFYSTIWSCLTHENEHDCIPSYTPYLKMKLGTVGLIPYAKPGTEELFKAFRERIKDSDGYLLRNHGPVAGGKDLMDAFYILEELEESAKVAWTLKDCEVQTIQ